MKILNLDDLTKRTQKNILSSWHLLFEYNVIIYTCRCVNVAFSCRIQLKKHVILPFTYL